MYTLHIADRPYSSWSLRGWLLVRAFGLPVETRLHSLRDPAFAAYREAVPARGVVPALEWVEGGERRMVWETLAIAESLAERHPDAGHWPADAGARAAARVCAAAMAAGFGALRAEAPMNTRRDRPLAAPSPALLADLARMEALWAWARETGARDQDGPFLFGAAFTAADAFFAPIAFRVFPYHLPMAAPGLAYLRALRAHPCVREWTDAAAEDPVVNPAYEAL